ncbi:hypothetical protein NED98_12420 [Sphingomonas sp. MMSM20]|nr:hypothetical protein [Sphingomonas lycopersici]
MLKPRVRFVERPGRRGASYRASRKSSAMFSNRSLRSIIAAASDLDVSTIPSHIGKVADRG